MTTNDLIIKSRLAAHATGLASIRALMAKNPDASWDISYDYWYNPASDEYEPKTAIVVGSVYLNDVYGIEDVATSASEDGWELDMSIDQEVRGGVKFRVTIYGRQPYTQEEIDLLTGIGVLTVKERLYQDRTLACQIR